MVDVGSILIGAAVSGLVGYISYSYRNTIFCTIKSNSIDFVVEDNQLVTSPETGRKSRMTV